jgi:hypothetical protein
MYIDNSGKAVPISRDNLNMLRQDVNTALKHYKNLFSLQNNSILRQ